jgi:hypothetical protein
MWNERRDRHELWTTLDELDGVTDGLPTPATADLIDSLDRLRWLIQLLRVHQAEDGRAYSPSMLDEVNRQLGGNVLASVRPYLADPDNNGPALQTAATLVDTVLDSMKSWPVLSPRGAAQAAGKAWADYASAAATALDDLAEKVGELEAAASAVGTQQQELVAGISAQQESLATRVEEELRTTAAGVVTANDGEVQQSRQRMQDLLTSLAAEDERIRKLGEETRNIAATFAKRAQAQDYGRNARNKAVAGWVWDIFGVLIGGAALAILLWHFFNPTTGDGGATDNGVALALTRLAISGAAVGLAFLCFRRGSENHRESRRSKRAEIRLRTADPFLANLHPDVREAVLEGMADRIYLLGQLDEDPEPSTKKLSDYIAAVRGRKDVELGE